jgi:hypothetical protein
VEYRTLQSNGACSCCYKTIIRCEEVVVVFRATKHKKVVVLCDRCIENINNLTGESDGTE